MEHQTGVADFRNVIHWERIYTSEFIHISLDAFIANENTPKTQHCLSYLPIFHWINGGMLSAVDYSSADAKTAIIRD